ncbi:MAG TPA: formyltransferase family protein, partial [Gemmatimonadales bacterium]|nr:formyltransferase family protein [Gemmatimonadales bacterium]
MRIAVAVSGGGSNLQALLDALPAGGPAKVALVVSNTAKAGGLERARQAGISSLVFSDPSHGAEWLRHLHEHRIDLLVLAGYLKLVPAEVIAAYRGRIINIHPALLP